jgi:outer membrane protein assembly factor BamD
MKVKLYIFLSVTLLLSSCGEYAKLLKSTDLELKRTKAMEYYLDKQYAKANEILTQILPSFRATEHAEELTWISAQSLYGMRDYILAASQFKNFSDVYPYSDHAEEANFLAALCDYNLSPRAKLDQENTHNAIDGFLLFLRKFPSSSRVPEAQAHIKELQEKLVEKSYLNAKLYYDMNQYKAAIIALNNSLKEYPETVYREEMMYLKLYSLFLYAENSLYTKQKERYQETLDDYYSFMEEFPKSKYSKDVEKIYAETARNLKIGTTIDKSATQ